MDHPPIKPTQQRHYVSSSWVLNIFPLTGDERETTASKNHGDTSDGVTRSKGEYSTISKSDELYKSVAAQLGKEDQVVMWFVWKFELDPPYCCNAKRAQRVAITPAQAL